MSDTETLISAVRDIIEAGHGCGGKCQSGIYVYCSCHLDAERIVALVTTAAAADEREACAASVDRIALHQDYVGPREAMQDIATAIRARGEKPA